MKKKPKIKVIKKNELTVKQDLPEEKKVPEDDVRRKMQSNVTKWIKEFQERS